MIATKLFNSYRLKVFGKLLTRKEFRDLQAGKDVKVDKKLVDKYPYLFEEKISKGVKDGD